MYYPSGYFKAKAREALKGHWQTALLIALIVSLPSLLAQGIIVFTGNDPMDRLQAVIIAASRDGMLTQDLVLREVNAYMTGTGLWLTLGLNAAAFLIMPCLNLGMNKWMMDRVRKSADADSVSAVFCRIGLFFKAIGLQLLVILKVLLWMLPGIGVFAVMLLILTRAGSGTPESILQAANYMTLPASILAAAPAVIAALRYAMAEFILADEPETKITECIRRSKEQMRDLKWMLFSLLISFVFWYLLQQLGAIYLSVGSNVLSLVFQMLSGLALNAYITASLAAFYLETRLGRIPKRNEAAEGGQGTPERQA